MKSRIAVLCLLFVVPAAFLSGQAHLQGGFGFMYMEYRSEASPGGMGILHAGVTADLVIPVNRTLELGMEVGFYEGWDFLILMTVSVVGIPVDGLVRLNLASDRKAALEIRGGLWVTTITAVAIWDETASFSESRIHVGGRIVIDWFYVGADYMTAARILGATVTFEAGAKWSL
jgi:hypothetical protein